MQDDLTMAEWKFPEKFVFRFLFVFVLLFINSFSFPHHFIPDIGHYTHSFFEACAKWSGKNIFRIHHPYYSELVSDSTGFYIHAFNLFFIYIFIATLWSLMDRERKNDEKLRYYFFVL